MKKCIISSLFFSIILLISSCRRLKYVFKSDKELASNKIEEVMSTIENKDKEKLTSLFSKNTVEDVITLDSKMDELFTYYKGNKESFSTGLSSEEGTEKNGDYFKLVSISSDIKTTLDTFRLFILWSQVDERNIDDEGIQSLYILRFGDDPYSHYIDESGEEHCLSYWGDGKRTPGINIGKIYEEND